MGRLIAWVLFFAANILLLCALSMIICGYIKPQVSPFTLLEFSSHSMIFWCILHVSVLAGGFILVAIQKHRLPTPVDRSSSWTTGIYARVLKVCFFAAFLDLLFSGMRSVEFVNGHWWLLASRGSPREMITQPEAVAQLWCNVRSAGGFLTGTTVFSLTLIIAVLEQHLRPRANPHS